MPACSIARDKGLGDLDVDGSAEVGIDARPVPVDEGGEDALAFGVVLVRRPVLEADPVAGRAGEVALDVVGRQEDQGVEPRHSDLADGGLRLEQRGEGLRLAVGEQDGVVLGVEPAVLGAGPGAGVALDAARPRLASRRARSPAWSGRADRPRRWPRRSVWNSKLAHARYGSWSGRPVRMKSRPRRSHSYCEGVMMFQRGDSMRSPTLDRHISTAHRFDGSPLSSSTCLSNASRSSRLKRR